MSNSNTIKAQVAKVEIGQQEIEGLLLPDGTYAIAVEQIWNLFGSENDSVLKSQKYASQTLKRLAPQGFQNSHRVKVPDLQNGNARNSCLVIPIEGFEIVLAKLDRAGNIKAQDFRDNMVGLSIRQCFADAFNEKFEQEERQEWLTERQESKQVRLKLTDAIKWYIENFGDLLSENERKFLYVHVSNSINMALFGRCASKIKKDWNLGKNDLIRDYLEPDELRLYEQAEDTVCRLIYRTTNSEGQPKPK